MSGICCEVVAGGDATAAVVSEISPRSARQRRMKLRRFRFIAGADALDLSGELKQKKPRLDLAPSTTPTLSWKDQGVALPEIAKIQAESECMVGEQKETSSGEIAPVSSSETSQSLQVGSSVSDRYPRYGTTSVCGRRRDMEDTVSVHPYFFRRGSEVDAGYHFFGVFDGHGCSHVAVSCRDRMHEIVADELGSLRSGDWKASMERSFDRMDTEVVGRGSRGDPSNASCRCELQMPKCDHVGSTAVVAVVTSGHVVVANCGDSRAVLCRDGVPVPLSVDHKPDRPDELKRIEDAGGRVIYWEGARVLGVLAMSRAIGDGYLKPYVTAVPEVTVTARSGGDLCLILATDGLWDVVTHEVACDIVRVCLRSSVPAGSERACSDAAMLLTKLALARQSADNVSVVVVDLRARN